MWILYLKNEKNGIFAPKLVFEKPVLDVVNLNFMKLEFFLLCRTIDRQYWGKVLLSGTWKGFPSSLHPNRPSPDRRVGWVVSWDRILTFLHCAFSNVFPSNITPNPLTQHPADPLQTVDPRVGCSFPPTYKYKIQIQAISTSRPSPDRREEWVVSSHHHSNFEPGTCFTGTLAHV